MKVAPNTRRLALLGVALSLTLASAAWLFFGAREPEPAAVAPAKAATRATAKSTAAKPDVAKPGIAKSDVAKPEIAKPEAAESEIAKPVAAAPAAPATATVERETYAYAGVGRRDPFRPLIATAVIRPMSSELRLVAVVYDARGAGSVAILRDSTTKKQHRVRPGQLLGRMRVAQIRQKQVVFTIEELGFSRQEILGLQDSTATRLP